MKTFDEYAQIVKNDLLGGGTAINLAILYVGLSAAVASTFISKNVVTVRKVAAISSVTAILGVATVSEISKRLTEAEEEYSQYNDSLETSNIFHDVFHGISDKKSETRESKMQSTDVNKKLLMEQEEL